MRDTPVLVDYATDGLEAASDRLLRRVVGWLAIVYGGLMLGNSVMTMTLAMKWAASPSSISWRLGDSWSVISTILHAAALAMLTFGGALLVLRVHASIIWLRLATVSSLVLLFANIARSIHTNTIPISFWSTPVAYITYSYHYITALWVPGMVLALTLPPLARRMV